MVLSTRDCTYIFFPFLSLSPSLFFFLSPSPALVLPLPDCEHLIRRMLVLDPSKRLSVAQIKEHKWMALDVPVQRPMLYQQESDLGVGEYSEQVLRLMHSLGIDQHKTIEVRDGRERGCFVPYIDPYF